MSGETLQEVSGARAVVERAEAKWKETKHRLLVMLQGEAIGDVRAECGLASGVETATPPLPEPGADGTEPSGARQVCNQHDRKQRSTHQGPEGAAGGAESQCESSVQGSSTIEADQASVRRRASTSKAESRNNARRLAFGPFSGIDLPSYEPAPIRKTVRSRDQRSTASFAASLSCVQTAQPIRHERSASVRPKRTIAGTSSRGSVLLRRVRKLASPLLEVRSAAVTARQLRTSSTGMRASAARPSNASVSRANPRASSLILSTSTRLHGSLLLPILSQSRALPPVRRLEPPAAVLQRAVPAGSQPAIPPVRVAMSSSRARRARVSSPAAGSMVVFGARH